MPKFELIFLAATGYAMFVYFMVGIVFMILRDKKRRKP
jgi:amino acid transporter